MRVVSIVGARPQFIKLAPVSKAVRALHQEIVIHTGQHYDYNMSRQFFEELTLPLPDYHLEIGSGTHGAQTGRMLEAIERVLLEVRPDYVLVFGDTNSTLAGALAAAKLHIPIAHVEAGLRSFNREMPEEINRVVTDHLSCKLFCPTEGARLHLQNEGITSGVEVVGDVMYDILLSMRPGLEARSQSLLPELHVEPGAYILATIHRASNTDDAATMRSIASALDRIEVPVIFPVHPRTRARLEQYGIAWKSHVRLIDPVGYGTMLALESAAQRIITDSGGVQKEAFLLGVPCITLRQETEWPETIEADWNTLVGSDAHAIIAAVQQPVPAPSREHPYGVGDAAQRIAQLL